MKTLKRNSLFSILLVLLACVLAVLLVVSISTPATAYAATSDNNSISDTSPFIFTRLNDTECSVRLSDKTVETAVVPDKVIIENTEYEVTAVVGSGFASATNLK